MLGWNCLSLLFSSRLSFLSCTGNEDSVSNVCVGVCVCVCVCACVGTGVVV